MSKSLFPKCSFCIELTNEQVSKIFDIFDKQKTPYYYIYNCGAVTCNCNSEKDAKYILQVEDVDEVKNWLATPDYLRTSKDGVFIRLMTPGNPDNDKPIPEFKDVFKMFEVTDEYLKEKSGE